MATAFLRSNTMPVITLSEATYRKLQSFAEPFVDTEESVILAALDALSFSRDQKTFKRSDDTETQIMAIDANSRVSLTHTRLRSAKVDGQPIYNPKWNSVMQQLLVIAVKRQMTFGELKDATNARLYEGVHTNDGFKYIPEAGLSVQGVNSQNAWDISLQLAQHLKIPIKVVFEWHNKPEAEHPGETRELSWKPSRYLYKGETIVTTAKALQTNPQIDVNTRYPWMHEIESRPRLHRLAKILNQCLEAVAPGINFEKGESGKYVARPDNFVTIKPQLTKGDFLISVYGPFKQNDNAARCLGVKVSRPPYEEFYFNGNSSEDSVIRILKEAKSNRARK